MEPTTRLLLSKLCAAHEELGRIRELFKQGKANTDELRSANGSVRDARRAYVDHKNRLTD